MIQRYLHHPSTAPFLLAAGLIVLIAGVFLISTGHDHAWLLHEARLLVHGMRPHQPLSDPFIVIRLFHVPPVLLAEWLHWHILFAFKVYSVLLLLGLMAICYQQLRLLGAPFRTAMLWLVAMLPVTFPPIIEFAQRDHFIAILFIPYLFTMAARNFQKQTGQFWPALSGVLAATAILLKPHYALVPILLELHLLFHTRNIRNLFRAENCIIATVGLAWLLGTALTMPMALSEELPCLSLFYWVYSDSWAERFSLLQLAVWIALLSSLRIRLPADASRIRAMALFAIAGSYLAFLLLGNNWPYRLIPFLGLSWLYFWSLFLYQRPLPSARNNAQRDNSGAGILVINLALLLVVYMAAWQQNGLLTRMQKWMHGERMEWAINMGSYLQLQEAFSTLPPPQSMLVLDTQLFPYTLFMMQYEIEWPSRYHSLWMLPAWEKARRGEVEFSGAEKARMEQFMSTLHERFGQDLKAGLPDVILVDISEIKPIFDSTPFDHISYFQEHVPYFREIWPQYLLVKSIYLGNQKNVAKGIDTQREIAIYYRKDLLPSR